MLSGARISGYTGYACVMVPILGYEYDHQCSFMFEIWAHGVGSYGYSKFRIKCVALGIDEEVEEAFDFMGVRIVVAEDDYGEDDPGWLVEADVIDDDASKALEELNKKLYKKRKEA